MADVKLVHSIVHTHKDDISQTDRHSVASEEFEACPSLSKLSFGDNNDNDNDDDNNKSASIPTPEDNKKYRCASDSSSTDGRSRYRMTPMSLVFGAQDESEPEVRPGKNKVMSATEPRRPSLSIKRIGEYDLIKTLGSGSTGKVKLAVHRTSHEKLAVKIVPRNQLDPNRKNSKETIIARERRILREAAILNLIDHQSIVKLKDLLITEEYFCLFFEYIEGVQLLDYIIMNGRLKERQARSIFRQILSAVDYCHHYSIVHRDLKIENILVEEQSGMIKLLDFGLSNFYTRDDNLSTFCGSLYFAAPELLCGREYTGPEVDVWSLGIVLFVLVAGKVPFDDKNLATLHDKIKRCKLEIPDHVSDEGKELLTRMICRDPLQRATMDDVIFHPWVNEGGYSAVPAYLPPERKPLEDIDDVIVALLVKEFDMQFTETEIKQILQDASRDSLLTHPVLSLYHLAKDKLYQPNGLERSADISVDSIERSRSLSFLSGNNTSNSMETNGSFKQQQQQQTHRHDQNENNALSVGKTKRINIPNRHQSRSMSMTSSPMSRRVADDYFNIKTVYLRGFFSVNTTTRKSPMAIRQEIQQYLMFNNIKFEDYRSYFVCEYRPSLVSMFGQAQVGLLIFEVHIVKIAFLGLHGLQFKRVRGDISQYKNLQSQMISSLTL